MKNRTFHIICAFLTIISIFIALILLFILDFESILINENGEKTISIVRGFDAIFGGEIIIIRGSYIEGKMVLDPALYRFSNFSFDYLNLLFLIICILSLIFMIIYFNRKILLSISIFINLISFVGLSLEPYTFLLVNDGNSLIKELFNLNNGNIILPIGLIVFLIVLFIIDLFYIFRVVSLFRNKVSIDK